MPPGAILFGVESLGFWFRRPSSETLPSEIEMLDISSWLFARLILSTCSVRSPEFEPCVDIPTMYEGVNVDQVKSMQRVAIVLTRGRSYLASIWFSSETLGL